MPTLSDWKDFFTAEAGATASLAGLIFVGVSINLSRILAHAALPDRAAESMMQMIGGLIVASLGLVPGQPAWAFGAEVLAVGAVLWLAASAMQYRYLRTRQNDPLTWVLSRVAMNQLATLPYILCGALVIAGQGWGLWLLATGFVFSIIGAVTSAWVLLVEIHR